MIVMREGSRGQGMECTRLSICLFGLLKGPLIGKNARVETRGLGSLCLGPLWSPARVSPASIRQIVGRGELEVAVLQYLPLFGSFIA